MLLSQTFKLEPRNKPTLLRTIVGTENLICTGDGGGARMGHFWILSLFWRLPTALCVLTSRSLNDYVLSSLSIWRRDTPATQPSLIPPHYPNLHNSYTGFNFHKPSTNRHARWW